MRRLPARLITNESLDVASLVFKKYRRPIAWIGCLVFSCLLFIAQGPDQPLRMLSCAEQYYLGQQVAMGRALYGDMAWNKTPLSIYINSLCFVVCGNALIPSVILTRFIYWAIFFAGAWPLYGLGRILLGKKPWAALGVGLYLCFPFVLHHLAGEPDWHLPMITLGVYAVYASARSRYFGAGLSAGLAFLSWQPGLIFFFIIMACIGAGEDKPRRAWGAATAGFGLPVAVFVIYFLSQGILLDFMRLAFLSTWQNIAQGFWDEVKRIPHYADFCYAVYKPVIVLSAAGVILHGLTLGRSWSQFRQKKAELGIGLAAILTVGYSLVDFQHCDDFLVFIPWVSLYAVYPLRHIWGLSPRMISRLAGGVLILIFIAGMSRSAGNPGPGVMRFLGHSPGAALSGQQDSFFRLLGKCGFERGDRIVCLETALPCLLTAQENTGNKYIYLLDDYYAAYIRQHEPEAAIRLGEVLSSRDAAFVFFMHDTLERRRHQEWAGRLKALLNENYRRLKVDRLDIWSRGKG